jgi:HTH-type transcriptional regulator/antitoxin HigA
MARTTFTPDYAPHPGAILEEDLEALGMTRAELAARCGRPLKTISEILHGKAQITPETAMQLERVLGRPAAVWQNLEVAYRLHLASRAEAPILASHVAWAKRFPLKQMVANGWLEVGERPEDIVRALLEYFGVGSVAALEHSGPGAVAAFRRSPAFEAAPEAVAAWLRRGEVEGMEAECAPFSRAKLKASLSELRELTLHPVPTVVDRLRELCGELGIALVFVPELPKTHLSGAARWLSKDKALIQLSLRHKTGDHFWFSFFHELGHVFLHGKRQSFIDEHSAKPGDDLEREANRFASDLLIPPAPLEAFVGAADLSARAIRRFATTIRTHPGIVVGRLQFDGHLPHSHHWDLKERLELTSSRP